MMHFKHALSIKIMRESVKMLLLSSAISSIGGIGLEFIQQKLVFLLPLVILIPALNDMVGDFGIVFASRFTTELFIGKIKPEHWWKSGAVRHLIFCIGSVALIIAVYLAIISYALAVFRGFEFLPALFLKLLLTSLIATVVIVLVLFAVVIAFGINVFRKNHDPDNYLIPLATALADLGSMAILSLMIALFF